MTYLYECETMDAKVSNCLDVRVIDAAMHLLLLSTTFIAFLVQK